MFMPFDSVLNLLWKGRGAKNRRGILINKIESDCYLSKIYDCCILINKIESDCYLSKIYDCWKKENGSDQLKLSLNVVIIVVMKQEMN